MKWIRGTRAAGALSALVLAVGCGSSQPASRAPCGGTLGIEVVPVSSQIRKTLALPKGFHGAIVGEVLPGGPAAAAGIQSHDIVEKIGPIDIANDCEFVGAAYNRSCEPVRVVLRRGGATVEATLVPLERARLPRPGLSRSSAVPSRPSASLSARPRWCCRD